MRLAWRYVRRRLGMFAACIALLFIDTAADLVQPTLMSLAVDEGVAQRDVGRVLAVGAVMLAVAAAGCVCVVVRNRLSIEVAQASGAELRQDAYESVLAAAPSWADRLGPGAIVTRLTNDVAAVVDLVMSWMRIAVRMPLMCVASIAFIVYQTPWMAPALLACVAAAGAAIFGSARMGAPRFARMQASLDRLNSSSREFLSSVRVVKSFGAEGEETSRMKAASDAYAQAAISSMRVEAVAQPLVNMALNMGVVCLLWLAQAQDAAQIGRVMASVNYLSQLAISMGLVGGVVNRTVRAQACARRIEEVLGAGRAAGEEAALRGGKAAGEPGEAASPAAAVGPASGHASDRREAGGLAPDASPAAQAPSAPPAFPQAASPAASAAALPGGVELRHVGFTYEGSPRPALADVCAEAGPGESLGVVGPTGSGKTTLLRLLLRLCAPSCGDVLVCGREVGSIPEAELRTLVSVVPQAPSLFSGTVADNLRWGDDSADDARMWEALADACADGFVSALPGGLGAVIGQGGANLSGGQRQRLCIARALLRRPQVLLLDDCTSALDGATEQRVLRNLARRLEGTTVVAVSQRVSTVRGCARILCLEAGRQAGYGTHAQLAAGNGLYRLICESQGVAVPESAAPAVLDAAVPQLAPSVLDAAVSGGLSPDPARSERGR